jgi:hypothetical protein
MCMYVIYEIMIDSYCDYLSLHRNVKLHALSFTKHFDCFVTGRRVKDFL